MARFFFHISYHYWGEEYRLLDQGLRYTRGSLNQGSLNQGSTVAVISSTKATL